MAYISENDNKEDLIDEDDYESEASGPVSDSDLAESDDEDDVEDV
jgi:hypothetical protein